MATTSQTSKGIGAAQAKPALRRGVGRPRQIPHGSTHEDIYARLKRALMSGNFVPGERLVVSRLEKIFGTSAMPIREALRRLVAEQALENNPNRGVIVPPMTPKRLIDLCRVRCEFEGKAVEWAALTISENELARLAELQAELWRISKSGADGNADAAGYLDLNLDFHFTIYRAARLPLLIPIIESLWMQAGPSLTAMRGETTLGLGMEHHDDMLHGLRKGDGAGARKALEQDISEAAEIILRLHSGDIAD